MFEKEKKKKNQTWPRGQKKKFWRLCSVPSCEPVWHIVTLFTSWGGWHHVMYFRNSWETQPRSGRRSLEAHGWEACKSELQSRYRAYFRAQRWARGEGAGVLRTRRVLAAEMGAALMQITEAAWGTCEGPSRFLPSPWRALMISPPLCCYSHPTAPGTRWSCCSCSVTCPQSAVCQGCDTVTSWGQMPVVVWLHCSPEPLAEAVIC